MDRAAEDQLGGGLILRRELLDDGTDAVVVVQQLGVDLCVGAEGLDCRLDGHGRGGARLRRAGRTDGRSGCRPRPRLTLSVLCGRDGVGG